MKRWTVWMSGVLLLAGCYDLRGTPGTDAGSDAGGDAGVPLDVVDTGESVDAVDAAGMDAASSDVVDAGESIDADVLQDQGPQDVADDRGAPADAAEDGGDAAEASVDTGIAACAAGELRCGDVCVQPQTDPAHCGACGYRCTLSNATATCTDGACRVLACTEGFADCDGTAANGCEQPTRSDNAHCGACRNACTQGRLCVDGACTCPSGQTFCTEAMACLNLQRDNNHCGACGNACTGGQSCQSGVCTCPTGQTLCGGACVNTSNDVAHCGVCGHVCGVPTGGNATCVVGTCGIVCNDGWHACGPTCADNTAAATCGTRCEPCPVPTNATATCTMGACGFACNAEYQLSGESCVPRPPRWPHARTHTRPVTVTNASTTSLPDYPVRIELTGSNFDFSIARPDGADLLPVSANFLAILPYWIERWDSSAERAIVWVRVPEVPTGTDVVLNLLYGNAQATSSSSRYGRFEIYDDFEGTSLDRSQWEVISEVDTGFSLRPGMVSVGGGELVIDGGGAHTWSGVRSIRTFRAAGATLRAEMFAWSRSGNSFCYVAPNFGFRSTRGTIDYQNSGDTYWTGPFQSLAGTPVEGGRPRSSSMSLALTYTHAQAQVYINGSLQGTKASGLVADSDPFRLIIYLNNPYDGVTTFRTSRIEVTRVASPEPTTIVGSSLAR